MARVTQQKGPKHNGGGYANNRAAQVAKQQRNKKQKVVVENKSNNKDAPRNVVSKPAKTVRGHGPQHPRAHPRHQLSFHTEPPPGYTFIPAGNPQLTAALKDFAKRGNHKIYSVSVCCCTRVHLFANRHQTTPHAARHELSREVHRVGFHFPTSVVAQVCSHFGIRLTRAGRVMDERAEDMLFMKVYQKGELVLDEKVQDQVTINTEAKETIRDLFPNIPDNDLFQIIKTAFQLGDGKVGTADEIPLHRRATLSVVAHIRHVYTKYDKLLRRMAYNNARHEVEAETLSKLVEWRGDGSADSGAINDILDDVIVISDGDQSEDEPGIHQIRQDHIRVEELDGNAYWPASGRPLSPLPAEDAASGYRFPPASHRYRPTEAAVALRERNRAARWEQAREDYRSAQVQPGPSYQRIVAREPSPVRRLIPLDPPATRVIEREYLGPALHRPQEIEVGHQLMHPSSSLPACRAGTNTDTGQVLSRPASPPYLRPAVRYERIEDDYRHPQPLHQIQARQVTPPQERYRRRSASPNGNGTIVQSIEGPNGGYPPAATRANEEAVRRNQQIRASYRDRHDPLPGRSSPIDVTSRAPRNPFQSPREPPRTVHEQSSMAQQDFESFGARRILIPEDEYMRSGPRDNPFQQRQLQEVRRLEPLPPSTIDSIRSPYGHTPPRRILEPISDPYSDSGPQRYREHLPVTEPYYGSAPASTQYLQPERRIVYAQPQEEYVTTTRYEPLPDPHYVRR